ncbi:MAG: DUF2283 domain-containing protein [Solirubrobacterales bacterium]|nr:DUF2283 domain-containing protein [Solirubrobacterales bacterium]MBV9537006.1 DUF2283 domain-containing protein [Solirubrobacterales bacterium]
MDRLNINIDGLTFDHAEYDAEGDVLYLARGEGGPASGAALTPEGHGIRYGPDGEVIGVTIINTRSSSGEMATSRSRSHIRCKLARTCSHRR